jgi:hypothetical protein
MTYEQMKAALLIMNGELLPADLTAALAGQGILIDEFIKNFSK